MLQHLSLLQQLHTLLLGVCLWSFITAILIGSLYLQSNKNTPHQRCFNTLVVKEQQVSHLLTVCRSMLVIPKDPSPSMRMVRASGLATWQPKNEPKKLATKKNTPWKIAWFNRYSPPFLQKKVCQTKHVAWAPMAKGKPAPITPKLPLVMKVRGLNFNFSQKFTKMVCFWCSISVTSNHLSIELGPPDELTWHHLMIAHSCCHNDVLLLLFLKKGVNGFDHLTLKCWQKWIEP